MALTTPDAIRSPNDGDQYALVQDLGVLADSTQVAITRRANMYVGTSAQRVAFTTAADGVHWQDTNGGRYEWIRTGGAWRGVRPLTGTVNLTAPSSGGRDSATINFPTGYFATAPAGLTTGASVVPESHSTSATTNASSITVYMYRNNNTTTPVTWTAIPSL